MSITHEITVWCDEPGCFRWEQFNHHDAGGSKRVARKLAARQGWRFTPGRGDRCKEHAGTDRDAR